MGKKKTFAPNEYQTTHPQPGPFTTLSDSDRIQSGKASSVSFRRHFHSVMGVMAVPENEV